MGSRSPSAWFVALAARSSARSSSFVVAPALAAAASAGRPAPGSVRSPARSRARSSRRARATAPATAAWTSSRAPGTPVRAANAGEVTFAGNVAGSLHVVVAHAGGLRTSYSFLATIAVRRGQHVARGDVARHRGRRRRRPRRRPALRAPGGGAVRRPDGALRAGRPHPADPPRARSTSPTQAGFDPPAVESRSLAESLHLPAGRARTSCRRTTAAACSTGSARRSATRPTWLGRGARPRRRSSLGAARPGSGAAPARRAGRGRARDGRSGCWRGPAHARLHRRHDAAGERRRVRPPGDDRRRHQQQHRARTASRSQLDTDRARLPRRRGHVFSYAPTAAPYTKEQTPGPTCIVDAQSLGDQLRALQREAPGSRGRPRSPTRRAAWWSPSSSRTSTTPSDPTLPPLGTVVTLSSPLQGAPAATAARRGSASRRRPGASLDGGRRGRRRRCCRPPRGTSTAQLAEGSPFMRRLRSAPLPEQIDLTSIGAVDDFIVPADHTTHRRARTRSPSTRPGPSDHTADLPRPRRARRGPARARAAPAAVRRRRRRRARRGRARRHQPRRAHRSATSIGAARTPLDLLLGQGDAP